MDEPFASVQRGGFLQSAGRKTLPIWFTCRVMSDAIPGISWGLVKWCCAPLCILMKGWFDTVCPAMASRPDQQRS